MITTSGRTPLGRRAHGRLGALVLTCLVLAAVLAVSPAAAKKKKSEKDPFADRVTIENERLLMNGRCTVSADGLDSAYVRKAIEDAFTDIAKVEQAIGTWSGASEASALGSTPAQNRVPISATLSQALGAALDIASETEGAFDPTIGPLVKAWDLRDGGRMPTPEELNDARTRVGYNRVRLDTAEPSVWFQREGMSLWFDGIACGVALDRVERLLRDRQVRRAIVNLDGRVLAMSDNQPFQVVVSEPGSPARAAVNLVAKNGAVVTADPAVHAFTAGGTHYGSIIDPSRGTPIEPHASVTIVTRSATRADALSMALLVMGREHAEQYALAHPDVGVLWLEHDNMDLHGWRWNLSAVASAKNSRVKWMN